LDYFDYYLKQKFEKSLQIGTIPEEFHIPCDEQVKKRWIKILYTKAVKKQKLTPFCLMFFKEIINSDPSSFALEDLQKLMEERVIKQYQKTILPLEVNLLWNTSTSLFATTLVNSSYISKAGIINIWHATSQQFSEKPFLLSSLLEIVKNCSGRVRNVYESELKVKLQAIEKTMQCSLYKKDFISSRRELRLILKYLKQLLEESTPKIELQNSEELSRIHDGFKVIVNRIQNREMFNGLDFSLTFVPEIDAKFYFDNAIVNQQTARELGSILPCILSSEELKRAILAIAQQRFMRQHSEATRSEYSDEEILVTNCFIAELVCKRYMTKQKALSLVKFIKSQENCSAISTGCAATLSTAMTSSEEPELDMLEA
jgi:hypothetical protein